MPNERLLSHVESPGNRPAHSPSAVGDVFLFRSACDALTIKLVSPRAKHELAREHLDRGLAGLTASDTTEAVAWLFLSLEAAIVSVGDKHGLDPKKQHWRKAEVAEELYKQGVLPHDYSGTLRLLNEARKVATYEGDEPDLEGQSLEDIAAAVEGAVELAEMEAT
jgi:hypothetical protein